MHKHKVSHEKVIGWSHCVTPAECAANPKRQEAHGNIVYRAVCSCGATRESESNGSRVNHGAWVEAVDMAAQLLRHAERIAFSQAQPDGGAPQAKQEARS